MVRRVNDSLSLLYVSMQAEVRLSQTIKRGIMACGNDTGPVTPNNVRNESGHMFGEPLQGYVCRQNVKEMLEKEIKGTQR